MAVSRSNLDHSFNEVQSCDRLGHGVLNLQSSIDLKEVELFRVNIVNIFDRADVAVLHRRGEALGCFSHPIPDSQRHKDGGAFLNDLLIPSLQRTIPLAGGRDVSLAVAKHLNLYVPGILDEMLNKHASVAKVRLGESLHAMIRLGQTLCVIAPTKPNAATAGRALEHYGVFDALSFGEGLVDALEKRFAPGNDRDASRDGDLARKVLQTQLAHLVGRRADPDKARILDL
ncbi:hypothetical protein HYQ46_009531 [Verticillium longisporum]|nr:hypothetical protein HYQ46_009531 [Verticillium longisporum]